jgi:hypothetical protein
MLSFAKMVYRPRAYKDSRYRCVSRVKVYISAGGCVNHIGTTIFYINPYAECVHTKETAKK